MKTNHMKLSFDALSCNEAFARISVAAFMTQLNPTVEEVADVKTAVSEAVTNCIIHAYDNVLDRSNAQVEIECEISEDKLFVCVRDFGLGIDDIRQAMEPLFTSKPQLERSGMGFAFMEAFMDTLEVKSKPGEGTVVQMMKRIESASNREA